MTRWISWYYLQHFQKSSLLRILAHTDHWWRVSSCLFLVVLAGESKHSPNCLLGIHTHCKGELHGQLLFADFPLILQIPVKFLKYICNKLLWSYHSHRWCMVCRKCWFQHRYWNRMVDSTILWSCSFLDSTCGWVTSEVFAFWGEVGKGRFLNSDTWFLWLRLCCQPRNS